jgi:UDP-N-acetylglucosamine 2-epimerase (non-hydrolysing)
VTVTEGTNQIVGTDEKKILSAVTKILNRKSEKKVRIPAFWDGKAARRIINVIVSEAPCLPAGRKQSLK